MVDFGQRQDSPHASGWLATVLRVVTAPVEELPASLMLGLVSANLLLVHSLTAMILSSGTPAMGKRFGPTPAAPMATSASLPSGPNTQRGGDALSLPTDNPVRP